MEVFGNFPRRTVHSNLQFVTTEYDRMTIDPSEVVQIGVCAKPLRPAAAIQRNTGHAGPVCGLGQAAEMLAYRRLRTGRFKPKGRRGSLDLVSEDACRSS
jgi:hypothetical protein